MSIKVSKQLYNNMPKLSKIKISEGVWTLNNRSIDMISEFTAVRDKHNFKCLKPSCDHIWSTTWEAIHFNKSNCPNCMGQVVTKVRLAEKIEEMKSRCIEPIHRYKSTHHKTEFKCTKPQCLYIWTTSWNSVSNKRSGCPKCAGQVVSSDEKIIASFRSKLRFRLSQMVKHGYLSVRCDKDDIYMNTITNHWTSQLDSLPKEPTDGLNWHLDHIIPVSKFDHSDIEQVKLCWDYRNIQWLTQRQNCSKGYRLMPQYFNDWHYQVLDTLGLSV